MTLTDLLKIGILPYDIIHYDTCVDGKVINKTITANGDEYIEYHKIFGKDCNILHHKNAYITIANITKIERLSEHIAYVECYPNNKMETNMYIEKLSKYDELLNIAYSANDARIRDDVQYCAEQQLEEKNITKEQYDMIIHILDLQ